MTLLEEIQDRLRKHWQSNYRPIYIPNASRNIACRSYNHSVYISHVYIPEKLKRQKR